jgi:maltooligosyltrehalose trehalohydrolase
MFRAQLPEQVVSSQSLRAGRALKRRLPVGAEVAAGGVDFRVWAPRRRVVEVVLGGGRTEPLRPEAAGYHRGFVAGAAAGACYRFRLDGDITVPDPASRFQPEGPHGPSEVIDPSAFRWTDGGWRGVSMRDAVIYELHVGTLTEAGTWRAAAALLPAVAELGVTVLEVMPVADFPGRFGWGYDGVNLFAPSRLYGRPDDFRAFVDRAHGHGLGVLLDVVYNHLGPDGNYLREFSGDYFTGRYVTPWGESLNFDGDSSGPVRELFTSNAEHWVREYHLDGLRLDATHTVNDASPEHILAEVTRRVRESAGRRETLVIAEDEAQRTSLLAPPARGGWGVDAIWHDDLHHSMRVAATGRREGYFARCTGLADELAEFVARVPSEGSHGHGSYITFLQNHDQISVAPGGRRLHQLTSPGRWRALTSLVLLGPGAPMLFAGEEFAASAPFLYFADHEPGLAKLVREGRARHLAQFESLADPAAQAALTDPADPETFRRSVLDPRERTTHLPAVRLHRDLLSLRKSGAALDGRGPVRAARLTDHALAVRASGKLGEVLLVVNLGGDLKLGRDALLSPPPGARWSLRWSSDDVTYGGPGIPEAARAARLSPGESAILLVGAQTRARRSGPA